MTDLVYKNVLNDLKRKIKNQEFKNHKLPDERSLSESYNVSRSSIKRALSILSQQGLIFKKRGSGTFINPLYLKNRSIFQYEGSNLGITDSLKSQGVTPQIQLLDFKVIPASSDIIEDLFLKEGDFVYEIRRLRFVDHQPFMIETGYIPISIAPNLNQEIVSGSIFNYLAEELNKTGTKSFMSISAEPSNQEDQELLHLKENEPVGIISGIFFLDDGTPFEVSNMRVHYKYLNYNNFVDLSDE
ncbi:UTRA domain-containing protein [Lactobacillus sp. S2-2]|uniref:GntR family transcriptional regulator n=1 Tax=Lactobacillus sp. S2-2 TaxID=2692917 RepID=UPI001F34D984|nr:GntR family transcriptional regulator [Lactobacillus sp. S2-2]MCF6515279.1 UTRA domain-containing protein [Lactobacillus sp. S2-2]